MLGETMKIIRHAQEKNEQKVILSEQNVDHWEKLEVEMGVIESFVLISETPYLHILPCKISRQAGEQ